MNKKQQQQMYKDYLFGMALRIEREGKFYTLEESKKILNL